MIHRRLHLARRPYNADVAFYLGARDPHDPTQKATAIAAPPTYLPRDPGDEVAPTFTLTEEAAQELFERLWAEGFRPLRDRPQSDPGALDAARKEHIEDLRKFAFDTFGYHPD